MSKVSFDSVVASLRSVTDLAKIKDLKIFDDGKVAFKIQAGPQAAKLKTDLEAAVKTVANVSEVAITVDIERNSMGAGATATNPNASRGITGVKHIIAVSSGKGGVGKSTVSVNLATSLALEGMKVGLLDADIYGPNIPTMMGVTENPKLFNDPERGEMFIPPMSHNVKVMSMGFLIEGDQPVIWRGPMLHNILNQFCNKVDWESLDYLVIDLPPGTGDVQLSLAQMLPMAGAVIVTTPQEVALQDVRRALNMWEKVKVPALGVVENMSFFRGDDNKEYRIFGEGGGQMLARKFNTKLLAQMPLVSAVREGGDAGKPIVIKDAASESAKLFRELAQKVIAEVSALSAKSVSAPELQIGRF